MLILNDFCHPCPSDDALMEGGIPGYNYLYALHNKQYVEPIALHACHDCNHSSTLRRAHSCREGYYAHPSCVLLHAPDTTAMLPLHMFISLIDSWHLIAEYSVAHRPALSWACLSTVAVVVPRNSWYRHQQHTYTSSSIMVNQPVCFPQLHGQHWGCMGIHCNVCVQ